MRVAIGTGLAGRYELGKLALASDEPTKFRWSFPASIASNGERLEVVVGNCGKLGIMGESRRISMLLHRESDRELT